MKAALGVVLWLTGHRPSTRAKTEQHCLKSSEGAVGIATVMSLSCAGLRMLDQKQIRSHHLHVLDQDNKLEAGYTQGSKPFDGKKYLFLCVFVQYSAAAVCDRALHALLQ